MKKALRLQTDDDKVKNKLVEMIIAAEDSAVSDVALLATAYTRLRAMELKQEEGSWGQDLDPTSPDTAFAPETRANDTR